MSDPVFDAGEVIANRYQLVSKVGEGGMGAVWRAEHVTLKSPVAIKFIDASIAQNEEAAARFIREAQSAAALRSTHVVQIFDYGIDRGVPYIAMELLVGESLRDRMDRVRLTPRQLAEIMGQVCRAMSKAHEAGIVHRDLKPDNVFLVPEDDQEIAKVLDFGIAKVTDAGMGDVTGATRTGTILGTPYYMSPEQAHGNRQVDYRADLWALAIIVFECVTGNVPFQSDALGELILRICVHPIPRPSEFASVPAGFDEWFARAANRDPDQRFQSAREFADSLRFVLGVSFNEPYSVGGSGAPQAWGATPFPPASPGGSFQLTTNGHAAAALSQSHGDSLPPKPSGRSGVKKAWIAVAGALSLSVLAVGGIAIAMHGRAAPTSSGSGIEDAPTIPVSAAAPPSASAEATAAPSASIQVEPVVEPSADATPAPAPSANGALGKQKTTKPPVVSRPTAPAKRPVKPRATSSRPANTAAGNSAFEDRKW